MSLGFKRLKWFTFVICFQRAFIEVHLCILANQIHHHSLPSTKGDKSFTSWVSLVTFKTKFWLLCSQGHSCFWCLQFWLIYSQNSFVLTANIFGWYIHKTLLFLLLTVLVDIFTGLSCSCCLHFWLIYSQDPLVLAAYNFGWYIHRTLLFWLLTFLVDIFAGLSCSCCLEFWLIYS